MKSNTSGRAIMAATVLLILSAILVFAHRVPLFKSDSTAVLYEDSLFTALAERSQDVIRELDSQSDSDCGFLSSMQPVFASFDSSPVDIGPTRLADRSFITRTVLQYAILLEASSPSDFILRTRYARKRASRDDGQKHFLYIRADGRLLIGPDPTDATEQSPPIWLKRSETGKARLNGT